MTAVLLIYSALLGVVVGSFTNVVIARVPAGQSVIRPRSACPACAHPIRARDNIPVLSWAFLRAKCRDCAAPISARYPIIETVSGAGFLAAAALLGTDRIAVWPAAFYLVFLTISLSAIDLEHHRLPDRLTRPAAPTLLALLTVSAWVYDSWHQWLTALGGAAVMGAFFFMLWLVYPKGMGFGDVRLAPTIGAALGWGSWAHLAVGGFATFLTAGLVGACVMAAARCKGASTRGIGVPFGPFMFFGVAVAALCGGVLIEWYSALLTP